MLNIYTFEVQAMCPVHERQIDLYQVTVSSDVTIPVEKIIHFFAPYQAKQIYQEDLAATAATALGAHVEIVGIHSGVQVRSIAP